MTAELRRAERKVGCWPSNALRRGAYGLTRRQSMPLARIELAQGKSVEYRKTIGEVVYDAMVETLKVPKDDRFQIIAEHAGDNFIVDPNYLGIQRSKDCVIVQVTLNEGRTVDQKRAFYKAVAAGLEQKPNLPPHDVLLHILRRGKEKMSFVNLG